MKRVLVTGATGFIGSRVVRKLVERNYEVAVLLRASSDTWRLGEDISRVTVINGDFEDVGTYEAQVAQWSPDTIFHLAWHGVTKHHREETSQVRVNVAGTVDLFAAADRCGCKVFVSAGSQAEYGPCDERIYESRIARPTTLYGASKLATLQLLTQMAESRGIRLAWLRVFSVYGPMDHWETLIYRVIEQLLPGNRPATTKGEQLWDYLYIDDAAEAFVAAARTEKAKGVFNVASGDARPLHEIISTIREMINPDIPVGFGDVAYAKNQVMRLEGDVDRLQSITEWTPRTSLREGLLATIAWHRTRSNHC